MPCRRHVAIAAGNRATWAGREAAFARGINRPATRSRIGAVIRTAAHGPSAGAALPVFPAYHTFIGIWIGAGDHVIDLRYRPPYARWLGYSRGG